MMQEGSGMTLKRWMAAALMMAAGTTFCPRAGAEQVVVRPGRAQPAGPGMVNLPWTVNDSKGQTWRVYPTYLQNQGPTPNGGNTNTFSQSAVITINGQG